MPGHDYLEKMHTQLGIDLNWLLRNERSLDSVINRKADRDRIRAIFKRIEAISSSIRVLMTPETSFLVARAIYTADPAHEDAFFNLLGTLGSLGFTGQKWVVSLCESRATELALAKTREVSFRQRIKLVRLRLGFTNHGFSTMLGVPQTTWLSWELKRLPGLAAIAMTFGRLDVDLNWLIASTNPVLQPFSTDWDWEKLLP